MVCFSFHAKLITVVFSFVSTAMLSAVAVSALLVWLYYRFHLHQRSDFDDFEQGNEKAGSIIWRE